MMLPQFTPVASWKISYDQLIREKLHLVYAEVSSNMLLFSHSLASDSATPWTTALQASLSLTVSWSLLKLTSIASVMPSHHLFLCRPLLLPPSILPSIRVFSNEVALQIRWSKYWNFSFRLRPSNEYSGLISSRIDWFDLLAVQGTLRSLLQHYSSKKHQFFGAQPSLWSNSHIRTWLLEKP